ncbi:MAG: redox-regulated ATPase YchF [Patescibacteria group bacterium]|nr:redox-regulated ATPase YchF [Patescibacteria group bacterium]
MALKIGIVGLPNVGKSTLFNALTRSKAAQAANYAFCTIDPNIGVVEVPDLRLKKLEELVNPANTVPTTIEFVDVAGLVKGASKGEGLGNQFLSNIRECHAIAHVIRGFEDENVVHVHGKIDPQGDVEIIETELILADLKTVEKRLAKALSDAKSGDAKLKAYAERIGQLKEHLESGQTADKFATEEDTRELLRDLHLLTMKPTLYVMNIHENQIHDPIHEKLNVDPDRILKISAKVEEDLVGFSDEETNAYLKELGLAESGLNALIRSAYNSLGLVTFFTAGPKEARAWTIKKETKADKAASEIHTDFEKGFIKAEVIPYEKYIEAGGEIKAKEKGFMQLSGRDYIVQDGDVIYFHVKA